MVRGPEKGDASSATPENDDKLPEAEAEERFNRTLGNLVNTPHKPHTEKRESGEPNSRPASVPEKG